MKKQLLILTLAALLLVVWHLGGLALFGLVTVVSALAQWEFYSLFMPTPQTGRLKFWAWPWACSCWAWPGLRPPAPPRCR